MASEEQTRGRKQLWGKTRFAHERDTIKKALELRLKTEGPKPTLKYILGQLTQSQNSEDKLSQLHCFVYIVYALFHHSRHGGLNPTQIEKLAKMGSALLRSEGILPISSQLSFLYHDLYLALSHVAHNEGRLWDAAWKNEMAIYLSQRAEQNETLDSLPGRTSTD